jgi:uncharacterized membrane-anchored protein YjiN (DUF445 family)
LTALPRAAQGEMQGEMPTPDRVRRMRWTATGLLVAMAAVFILSGRYLDLHPAWGYVHAFAEAAMVGGLADWFAVTALFRHPLGLPIPHTAIIPQNKDRIADTMAQFLRENFLTPAVVARRMRAMNLAQAVGRYLTEPGEQGGSRIRAGAGDLLVEVLESLDPDRLGGQVRSALKTGLDRIEVAPLLGQMLEAMIADGRHRPLIDSIIRWAGLVLEDNEDMVRAMINQRANALLRFTGLDERLANSVLDGLYRMLAEVLIDPEHPLRAKVEHGLADLARSLREDPEMQAKVERMKREMLDNPAIATWWQGVWERLRHRLIEMVRGDGAGGMPGRLTESLAEMGTALRDDPRLQQQVNRFARRTAVGLTSRYGGQIVRLVSETVRGWDASTITGRVESAVGRDLQFIRINGTLVGGLVGLTLHFLSGVF